jgi:hypothetical protein
MKTQLLSVLLLLALPYFAQSQADSSSTDSVFLALGTIEETDFANDEIYLQIQTDSGEVLDFTTNEQVLLGNVPMSDTFDLAEYLETLQGERAEMRYTKAIFMEIVKYKPAMLSESVAVKGKALDERILVYTIKGIQESATETEEGWEVILRTPNDVKMRFVADESMFNGHNPWDFDGKELNLSYIQVSYYELQSFEIAK